MRGGTPELTSRLDEIDHRRSVAQERGRSRSARQHGVGIESDHLAAHARESEEPHALLFQPAAALFSLGDVPHRDQRQIARARR